MEKEPDWGDHAALRLRRILALSHLGRCHEALADWFGLFWQFPGTAAGALEMPELPDEGLRPFWEDFRALEPELAPEMFPAYVLLRCPARAREFADLATSADEPGARIFRIVRDLLNAAADDAGVPGRRVLFLRQSLCHRHEGLFEMYMAMQRRSR